MTWPLRSPAPPSSDPAGWTPYDMHLDACELRLLGLRCAPSRQQRRALWPVIPEQGTVSTVSPLSSGVGQDPLWRPETAVSMELYSAVCFATQAFVIKGSAFGFSLAKTISWWNFSRWLPGPCGCAGLPQISAASMTTPCRTSRSLGHWSGAEGVASLPKEMLSMLGECAGKPALC